MYFFFTPAVYYETHGGKLTASTSAPMFNPRENEQPESAEMTEALFPR